MERRTQVKKSVAASEKPVKAKEFDKELFKRSVEYNVRTLYRKNLEEADAQQIFQAVSYAIKDRIVENWMETQKAYEKEDPKMVYYMSMEFLMGRALGNNLINLKAYKPVAEALEELGLDFQNTTFGLLVTPKTDLDTMNNMLDTMGHDETAAMTLSYAKETLQENISSIKFLMFVIVIVIAVSISAAVCIVLETIYNDRMEEFGILYAIGYKKSWLFKNIIAEIMALVFVSWILGLVISYGFLTLVAKSVFEPMGQILSIFSIQSLFYTIIVMAVFVVVTILVTILKFAKKDLIAIIEMR